MRPQRLALELTDGGPLTCFTTWSLSPLSLTLIENFLSRKYAEDGDPLATWIRTHQERFQDEFARGEISDECLMFVIACIRSFQCPWWSWQRLVQWRLEAPFQWELWLRDCNGAPPATTGRLSREVTP